jgi:hypothetical protein
MRISCMDDDDGFLNFQAALSKGKLAYVFLDDRLISDCRTADEEKGFVEVICRDRNGNILITDDEVKLKRFTGKVNIELKGNPS